MFAFVVRRVAIGIVTIVAMIFLVFVLFFANGNPAVNQCGRYCTPEKIDAISRNLGYDEPITYQFGAFIQGLFVGRDYPVNEEYREQLIANGRERLIIHCDAPCLGYSLSQAKTVNELIVKAAPPTLGLTAVTFVLWIFFGVSFGILAAVFRGRWIDKTLVGVALVVYALPVFFTGSFLLQYVSIKWGLWPYPRFTELDEGIGPWLMGLLLPALTLSMLLAAGYTRITRAYVLESMSEDYIRTARAKGLPERTVLGKHGLRAALTPLVTMAGLDIAVLLSGAIITETVFNFKGLGALSVQANTNQDLPILIGMIVVAASAVIVMNIVVDALYAVIDPRVRIAK